MTIIIMLMRVYYRNCVVKYEQITIGIRFYNFSFDLIKITRPNAGI